MTNAIQSASINPLTERVAMAAASQALKKYPQLKAVIMIGSMARSEATWKRTSSGWEVLGDAEFVVVQNQARPSASDINSLCSEIEHALKAEQISCKVDVSLVPLEWLSNLPQTIFTYEIRTTGRVIFGEPSLLELIPDFPSAAIEREDAWRLVCNRLVEWLEASDDVSQSQYRSAKLLLDCASSLLVFTDNFEAGYERRAQNIRSLDKISGLDVDYKAFHELVSICTDYKLGRRDSLPNLSTIAPTIASRVAEWEQKRIETQPTLATRMRAWAFVGRATGWAKQAARWPRWGLQALSTTPRRLVYSAAMQIAKAKIGEIAFQEALVSINELPLISDSDVEDYSAACKEVAFNYNEFVLKSRA